MWLLRHFRPPVSLNFNPCSKLALKALSAAHVGSHFLNCAALHQTSVNPPNKAIEWGERRNPETFQRLNSAMIMYILYYIVMKDLKQGGVLLNTTEYSDLLDSELAFCNHTFVYCSLQGKKMALVEKSQEKQNAQKTRSVFLSYN